MFSLIVNSWTDENIPLLDSYEVTVKDIEKIDAQIDGIQKEIDSLNAQIHGSPSFLRIYPCFETAQLY